MISGFSLSQILTPTDHSRETRARLDQLTQMLASGEVTDPGRALNHDFSTYSRLAHDLTVNSAQTAVIAQAEVWTETAQGALASISGIGDRIAAAVPTSVNPSARQVQNFAALGASSLSDMIQKLNISVDGRAVFGNGKASAELLIDVAQLQADVALIARGASSPTALFQEFDAYFSAGGGFDVNAVSDIPAASVKFPLGSGEALTVPLSVEDEPIRSALKVAAIASGLSDVSFAFDDGTIGELAKNLTERMAQAGGGLASAQGRLGQIEEKFAKVKEEFLTMRNQLEARKAKAVAADPFEVAAKVQNEMTRLETIYAVTARRSRLRLTDFLR